LADLQPGRPRCPSRNVASFAATIALTVAAIEDLFLIEPNRFAHAIEADVLDQLVELRALKQRKEL
jgi:hypothetical protein